MLKKSAVLRRGLYAKVVLQKDHVANPITGKPIFSFNVND
jgi:hypothetical protein